MLNSYKKKKDNIFSSANKIIRLVKHFRDFGFPQFHKEIL